MVKARRRLIHLHLDDLVRLLRLNVVSREISTECFQAKEAKGGKGGCINYLKNSRAEFNRRKKVLLPTG